MKRKETKPMFEMPSTREKTAGQYHQFVCCELSTPQTENAAPVTGPMMKPMAKAIPINAYQS